MRAATWFMAGLMLGLLAGCARIPDQTVKPEDFNGYWQIITPVDQLLTATGAQPPLLPEALALYQQRSAARAAGDLSFDPAQRCASPGEPRLLSENGWPFQLLVLPEYLTFAYQWNRLTRIVPMNVPMGDYTGPYYSGQSVGRWQDDALVIDVIGVTAEAFLDSHGLPHSDDMKLTQTLRLKDSGQVLELRMVVDDPATYSQTWQTRLRFKRLPADTHIPEDVCLERMKLQLYPDLSP